MIELQIRRCLRWVGIRAREKVSLKDALLLFRHFYIFSEIKTTKKKKKKQQKTMMMEVIGDG